jgi:hypothetical protein
MKSKKDMIKMRDMCKEILENREWKDIIIMSTKQRAVIAGRLSTLNMILNDDLQTD